MNRLLVILFMHFTVMSFAQTSEKYNSVYADFYRAEELFQKQQYGAARKEFRAFIDQLKNEPNNALYIKAQYYEGLSALELFNNDAVDLLKRFNQNYPESIYKHMIHFRLGNYYYRAKKYQETLEYFAKFKVSDLEKEYHNEYYFKLGYANFQENNLEAARNAFYEIKDGESQYAAPALYYYSHIAYTEKNYQTALEGFTKLQNDESFAKVVPYYILQIFYLQGKYEEVTAYAPKLKDATVVNEKDVSHLVGDAYYRVGKFDEAVIYLEKYDKLAETSRDDDYQLGYAYFKSKQYEKAIKLLDRVARVGEDSLGQVAYYHIGESYLLLKNNLNARSAFQKASEIKADNAIQEDALYQFAVLSYKVDVNPYNESIRAFETYLNNYPNSKRKEDVYQYLVNVYTSTNNYEKALESLDRVANKDITLRKIYQLIAFNHGIELYQKGQYQPAINTLKLVDRYPINAALSAKATYWMADANYQLNNHATAIAGYSAYLGMPGTSDALKQDAYYNIAYANLQKGDTTKAIESFRTYVQEKPADKRKLGDAYMRLADSYFMRRENQNAIQYYDLAAKSGVSGLDQALYYKALSQGVEGDYQGKINTLLDLVNNHARSKYVQDALFEIALAYKLNKNYDKSIVYFEQIIRDYPTTPREAQIRIEIADSYYKLNNYKSAEKEYLTILEKFKDNDICGSVGEGLQHVYSATKQINKLEEYSRQYPCLNINSFTLENLLFSPGENDYEAKRYDKAVERLTEYLAKYPNGYHSKKALAYIGNSYFELKNEAKAVEYYELLLKEETNTYTELAAVRAARYYFNNKDYNKAIPHYERSEHVSTDLEIKFNAQLGLMRSFFHVKDYAPSAAYAKLVMASNLLKADNRLEANYITGMANFNIQAYAEAIPALTYVSKNTTQEIASEAKFYIAKSYFEQNNMTDAMNVAKEVLKMKPTYDYWIAKSLILQTEIQMAGGDLFQAEQTIQSVLTHYPNKTDGILEEAQKVADELMFIKNAPKSNLAPTGATEIEINNGN